MRLPKAVADFFARRRTRFIRRYMRGYANLKRTGRLDLVDELMNALADTPLGIDGRGSERFFGTSAPFAEKVVRQFLLARIGQGGLRPAILASFGTENGYLLNPVPPAWARTLRARGVKVPAMANSVLWIGYVVILFAHGLLAAIQSLALSLSTRTAFDLGESAYFDGVSRLQLPRKQQPSYDIFSWYANWNGKADGVTVLAHAIPEAGSRVAGTLPLAYCRQAQPYPRTWRGRMWHLQGTFALAAMALMDLLRGRWWHALLLREAERAHLVRIADPQHLAREYMMSNSGWLHRPLWTYAAEEAGSRVSFYFYSTNAATFKQASGYPRQSNHWELCTWSRYLVWEQGQLDFLTNIGLDGDILEVGPIWFSDTDAEFSPGDAPAIAVFDVQPMRNVLYRSLGLGFEYYTAPTAIAFAEGIAAAAASVEHRIIWKRKRDIGRNVHPAYARKLNELEQSGVLLTAEPGLAAQHLIALADCVISMPFTSTALLARSMGKPSCYYDPTGLVQPDDRAAYGIDVLTSPAALKDWIVVHAML